MEVPKIGLQKMTEHNTAPSDDNTSPIVLFQPSVV